MAKGWVTPAEAAELDPTFPERATWKYDPSLPGFTSPYGFGVVRVQLDNHGMPAFDRLCVGEPLVVNVVAYFIRQGVYYVSILDQTRPFADEATGIPAETPIVFAQPVMGFVDKIDKVIGETASDVLKRGALREVNEEANARPIKPPLQMGQYWGAPTGPFVTPTDLLAIEIDPSTITGETDHSELILKAEYIPFPELWDRIALGEHDGVNYRSGQMLSTFSVFLALHPDALTSW